MGSRRNTGIVGATLVAVALLAPNASAAPIAALTYFETQLGNGNWQYDYTIVNQADPLLDAGADLYDVFLTNATGTLVSVATPAGWDSIFGSAFADLFSTDVAFDILPGGSLGGFRLVFDQQVGQLAFDATFVNPADPANPTIYGGTTEPGVAQVPEPSSLLLIASALAGSLTARWRKRRTASPSQEAAALAGISAGVAGWDLGIDLASAAEAR